MDVQLVWKWDMRPGKGRLGAITWFHPTRTEPIMVHLGLEAVWAWTKASYPNEMQALATNLLYQCEYYDIEDLPGLRTIGKGPFYGAMSGNRDRLKYEIAAFGGITAEEFDALSRPERDKLNREHAEATMPSREDLLRHLDQPLSD